MCRIALAGRPGPSTRSTQLPACPRCRQRLEVIGRAGPKNGRERRAYTCPPALSSRRHAGTRVSTLREDDGPPGRKAGQVETRGRPVVRDTQAQAARGWATTLRGSSRMGQRAPEGHFHRPRNPLVIALCPPVRCTSRGMGRTRAPVVGLADFSQAARTARRRCPPGRS